jgi:nucleoside-diphosphate-sugar epimerase
VAVGEDQLLEQHGRGDFEAVILRYPGVFGPRTGTNHEWAVVRRVLDGRPFMILPHDGMSYFQRGYVDNLAWLVYLAATRPEAAGQCFNAGDEQVLPARRVAELIVDELKSPMELVGMPAGLCRGVFPLAEKSSAILDMSKCRLLLGYRDRVDVETATRLTARHLADNPPDEGDLNPQFHGRFDYAREDRLVAAWRAAMDGLAATLAAGGPGGGGAA